MKKTDLFVLQIFSLEEELEDARRMSNVVEEAGKKVDELETMKNRLEEEKNVLEGKMIEESHNYAEEKVV